MNEYRKIMHTLLLLVYYLHGRGITPSSKNYIVVHLALPCLNLALYYKCDIICLTVFFFYLHSICNNKKKNQVLLYSRQGKFYFLQIVFIYKLPYLKNRINYHHKNDQKLYKSCTVYVYINFKL